MSLLRLIRRGLLWLAGVIALYLGAGVWGAVIPGQSAPVTGSDGPTIDILLVRGPIHYDFLLPLDQTTRRHFAALKDAGLDMDHPAAARWLVIGWGARAFYTTTGSYSDVEVSAVVKGIFGDQSVIRADLAGTLPARVKTKRLSLSAPQYSALLSAISAGFSRDPSGRLQLLDIAGFTSTDLFFDANGRFDILRTCNVWVGQMLRAAGLRFGVWTPTPYAVTLSRWLWQMP